MYRKNTDSEHIITSKQLKDKKKLSITPGAEKYQKI